MKAYRFQIWHAVYSASGLFSHNAERIETIHANNLKAARAKITLQPKEFIYNTTCLGTVRKIIETRYEYTPLKKQKHESYY